MSELLRVGPTATNAELRSLLSGIERQYGPYTLQLRDVRYSNATETIRSGQGVPGIRYDAMLSDKYGRHVGTVSNIFYRDPQGRLVVENADLSLIPKAQGKGFATTFNASMDQYYRRSGVDRIELQAVDDGGLVWARSGYDYITDDPNLLAKSRSSIEERISKIYGKCSDADKAQLDDFIRRFGTGNPAEYPSPNELASLTSADPGRGEKVSLGEKLMKTSRWFGMRVL
ncbi:hypothetical protein ACFQZZ_13590 [Nocardia sp. GCM10030253]|uniref:hypothetical protein n=1 Tax=Nocardia sp. GCM10030253 TaxID=3273404 RepID=UPI003634A771